MAAQLLPAEIELLKEVLAKGRGDYTLDTVIGVANRGVQDLNSLISLLEAADQALEDLREKQSVYRLCLNVMEAQGKSSYLSDWFEKGGNLLEASHFLEGLIGDLGLVAFIANPDNLAYSKADLTKSIRRFGGMKVNFEYLALWSFWKELHDIADTHSADIRSKKEVIKELGYRGAEDVIERLNNIKDYGKLVAELVRQRRSGEADVLFENDDMPDDWTPPSFKV